MLIRKATGAAAAYIYHPYREDLPSPAELASTFLDEHILYMT